MSFDSPKPIRGLDVLSRLLSPWVVSWTQISIWLLFFASGKKWIYKVFIFYLLLIVPSPKITCYLPDIGIEIIHVRSFLFYKIKLQILTLAICVLIFLYRSQQASIQPIVQSHQCMHSILLRYYQILEFTGHHSHAHVWVWT